MENCIKSLLPGGNEVEILIVDDGSTKDNTAEIADRYEKEYPGICKAIHQENGGHGAAVNAGLKAATGIYFKVVDSDDWVNEQAYRQVLDTLRRFVYGKDTLDMLITNFVYEKQGARHKKVMSYKLALPKDELFSWNDVKVFVAGQYILMHSVIYRTELLRDCKLELPEHTFYVDNIFVYEPLPHVHTMYYLNVNFYRYFIGRSDQSVNEQVMISRLDQQFRVGGLCMIFIRSQLCHRSIQIINLIRFSGHCFRFLFPAPCKGQDCQKKQQSVYIVFHSAPPKKYNLTGSAP